MAPEQPDYVTVFDANTVANTDSLIGKAERLPLWEDKYRVSWYAKNQPPGYFAVGNGVAFVYGEEPEMPEREPMEIDFNSIGDAYFRWHDAVEKAESSFMFILILPEGYTLVDPMPTPKEAKVFNGRLALHWQLKGDNEQNTKVEWRLQRATSDPTIEVKKINTLIEAAHKAQNLPNLKKLRVVLEAKFNLEELELFCDELPVEYENLPGETRQKKIKELVGYMDRRDLLNELVEVLLKKRPSVDKQSLY